MKRCLAFIVLTGLLGCESRTADLEVRSIPPGAGVQLDGQPTGEATDCTLQGLYAGLHLIGLDSGDIYWEDTVDLRNGAGHVLTAELPKLRWVRELYGYGLTAPAVGDDGTVYVASGGALLALSPAGLELWDVPLSSSYGVTSPVVGDDGTVYVAAETVLYAFRDSGRLAWRQSLDYGYPSGIALGPDGAVYVTASNALFSFAAGARNWKKTVDTEGGSVNSAPAVGPSGAIYVVTYSGIHAVSASGQDLWRYSDEDNSYYGDDMAIDRDGTIYLRGGSGLTALNPDGTRKWRMALADYGWGGSPAISGDGTICIVLQDTMYGINPAGRVVWRAATGNTYGYGQYGTPAISAEGMIHGGTSSSGMVRSVGPGGMPAWEYSTTAGDTREGPAISSDSTMYVSRGTYLYSFKLPSGPAESGWPMYQHDARRTGRVSAAR